MLFVDCRKGLIMCARGHVRSDMVQISMEAFSSDVMFIPHLHALHTGFRDG